MSEKLFLNASMETPEAIPFLKSKSILFTRRCPGLDGPNEDSIGMVQVSEEFGVLMVADGMGGAPKGDEASSLAIKMIAESVMSHSRDIESMREAILNGIEAANEAILNLNTGAASTISVVEVLQDKIRPYHIGDSLIYVTGQRGKVKLETLSHSPTSYALEAGYIEEKEALHHEDRHLVTNYLGSQGMRIEIGPWIKLARYDTVLISSDGLTDNLYPQEVTETIRKGKLEKVAATLRKTILERMEHTHEDMPSKPDDLSVILYRRG